MTLTSSLGGQLNGTEDRSLNVNYIIDLMSLKDLDPGDPNYDSKNLYKQKYCGIAYSGPAPQFGADAGAVPTIAGDLGLGKIVADGLIALDTSKDYNLYGPTGPTPPTVARQIDHMLPGKISFKSKPDVTVTDLKGAIVIAPQATGALTQGTVTLSAVAKLRGAGNEVQYVVNLTGNLVPPDSDSSNYFSLTGSVSPVIKDQAGQQDAQTFIDDWGFSPTVTVNGTIDKNYDPDSIRLSGILTPVAGSKYATAPTGKPTPPPGAISIPALAAPADLLLGVAPGLAPAPGGKGASASSAGTTSFGSLVDFTLVYGLNGGPTWSFATFKGPASGSSPLLSLNRTHYDSLSITFVAACQKTAPAQIKNYWDSIGACNQIGSDAASAAYQANTLMILKNLIQKSGANFTP
jgi:hypothetical protein